ncbi:MAG: DUF1737 domain-containing protein [Verrucomicrobia bacterium]|nr:DUF1737 domain-containing protein [Verrucomicrobiota bacterium]
MKIKEYVVVEELSIKDLEEAVNGYIEEGWEPFGSPVVFNDHDMHRTHYHQAMIHHGPIDDD